MARDNDDLGIDRDTQPKDVLGFVGRFLFNANAGSAVTKLFDWMRDANEEQIHDFAGRMSFQDAKTFRRLIQVMKDENL